MDAHGKDIKKSVNSVRIVLPFRLPRWNDLLKMNRWERAKITKFIKHFVCLSIIEQTDLQIPTDVVLKLRSMDLSLEAYF